MLKWNINIKRKIKNWRLTFPSKMGFYYADYFTLEEALIKKWKEFWTLFLLFKSIIKNYKVKKAFPSSQQYLSTLYDLYKNEYKKDKNLLLREYQLWVGDDSRWLESFFQLPKFIAIIIFFWTLLFKIPFYWPLQVIFYFWSLLVRYLTLPLVALVNSILANVNKGNVFWIGTSKILNYTIIFISSFFGLLLVTELWKYLIWYIQWCIATWVEKTTAKLYKFNIWLQTADLDIILNKILGTSARWKKVEGILLMKARRVFWNYIIKKIRRSEGHKKVNKRKFLIYNLILPSVCHSFIIKLPEFLKWYIRYQKYKMALLLKYLYKFRCFYRKIALKLYRISIYYKIMLEVFLMIIKGIFVSILVVFGAKTLLRWIFADTSNYYHLRNKYSIRLFLIRTVRKKWPLKWPYKWPYKWNNKDILNRLKKKKHKNS